MFHRRDPFQRLSRDVDDSPRTDDRSPPISMEHFDVGRLVTPPRRHRNFSLLARDARPSSPATSDLANFFREGPPEVRTLQPGGERQARLLSDGPFPEKKHAHEYSISETIGSRSLMSRPTSREKLKHTDIIEASTHAEHAGLLYKDGLLVQQPAPSLDPKDPMNLSLSRKMLAVFFLCFFGALAAAAELILGALLPVFFLEYTGLDPKILAPMSDDNGGLPRGIDPWKSMAALPGAPPVWKVQLLASLPVLMMGLANLALVPLAISLGRRPIILISGIISILGAVWAGKSQTLGSHIGARCVQAIGAGTVESLIPFIIQDMVFVHQRNSWISCVFAAQGVIIISLGIATPYTVVNLSWRWVYFITASSAGFFLVGCFFFLPETKWHRTRAEMNGIAKRDNTVHTPRTWKGDMAIVTGPPEWRKGWNAFVDTIRTFFYPQILFITMLNSAMFAATLAAGYTVAPALLTNPWSWSFYKIGLSLTPVLIAAVFVALLTGLLADRLANFFAKTRGHRVPENQLLNLILPTLCAIIGAIFFGLAGSNISTYHWSIFLLGLGLLAFGFLGTNTVGAVYVLECYPHLAGPALVNIASFRCLIAFVLSFRVAEWITDFGYFKSMMIYVGIIGGFALLIPVVYIYGEGWRRRWPALHRGDDGW